MRSLAHLNKYLKKYIWRLILGSVFIFISNLFAIYAPRLIRDAFDLITNGLKAYTQHKGGQMTSLDLPKVIRQSYHFLGINTDRFLQINSAADLARDISYLAVTLGVLYLLVAILKGIFLFFTRQSIIVMSRLIEYDLKNEVFDHYQILSLSFYRRNNTGDLMNRISEDVSKVRMYLGPAIMYTINLLVLFVLSLSAMLSVNAELTLYVLTPLPVLSVVIYYVSNIINKRSEAVQRQQSTLSTFTQESFSGVRVLKAYNREAFKRQRFDEECDLYKKRSLSLVHVNALFQPSIILLIGLSTILTIYVGGIKAMHGEITVGNIAEFVVYVNMLTWPFASVGWVTSLVQRAAASQERINEFLRTEPDILSGRPDDLPIKGEITFDKVSFKYPESGIQALKDVSFTIPSGKTLAIIGRTGSGKSTIANLICRNFDPSEGTVELDGRDLRDYNLGNYRRNLGYVPQEVFLFSDTIADNISFGLEPGETTPQRIEQAAKDACVYDNIIDFPKGFDTKLGERGVTLSGGQKQRVSIARAIILEPKILIFDDCLSAVDTETEEAILRNLRRIMKNKTTLIISHRVSTIKGADEILVLDNGRIAERGNHSELIDENGIYAQLYRKQLLEEEQAEG